MSPALHSGDIVVVRKDASVHVGDVALVTARGHKAYLHRVISRDKTACKLKGDANPIPDRVPVPLSAVEGPVVAVIPFGEWAQEWR